MTQNYQDEILHILKQSSIPLSSSEIFERMRVKRARRTLQRELQKLLSNGHIQKSGLGRRTEYTLSHTNELQETASSAIPLSSKATKLRSITSLPLDQRKQMGYNSKFLESYKPNHSFYLTKKERKQLWDIGRQSETARPAGTYAREIFNRLLIDLSWNSSRLEGNTYSLLETERLLEEGIAAKKRTTLETQMLLNHKQAIEFLVECAKELTPNEITIRNLHALLSEGLLGNSEACGRVRTILQQIEAFFRLILSKATSIQDPFEQAFFLMVHLPYLQPFEDVNKRVARLAANIPLIKGNFCPLSFIDVPESFYVEGIIGVYELNQVDLLKDFFLWAYHRSTLKYSTIRHIVGSPDPFRLQYRDKIKSTVREIVLQKSDKEQANELIQNWTAHNIVDADRQKFVEIVESELLSLHVGNVQRYKISPKQFETWQKVWNQA